MASSQRPASLSFPPSVTDAEIRLSLLRRAFEGPISAEQLHVLEGFAAQAAIVDSRDVLLVLVRAILEREPEELVEIHAQAIGTAPFVERLLRHASDERSIGGAEVLADPPLGMRKFDASRPKRAAVEHFLLDPDPRVIERVLRNPMLKEADALRIVTSPRTNAAVLRMVARSRWLSREHIRRAIILGARTPLAVAVPVLAVVGGRDLEEVIATSRLPEELRLLAREWQRDRKERALSLS